MWLAPSNYAQISIVNRSQTELEQVELTEDRFGNRYIAEGLAPGASVSFPVYAWGELGYELRAVTARGTEYSEEFYAESGYRVTHTVSESGIGTTRTLY